MLNPDLYKSFMVTNLGALQVIAGVTNVIELLGAYGAFQWKRWGVYLIGISFINSLIIQFFFLHSGIGLMIGTILLGLVVFFPMYKKWSLFS